MTPQTKKKIPLGPTGEVVKENVARLRGAMQYKQLSEQLAAAGRPIPPLGLRRIEAGERRVDVDDLMALAIVFGVAPNALLLPHVDDNGETEVTGSHRAYPIHHLWGWANGHSALNREDKEARLRYLMDSNPRLLGGEMPGVTDRESAEYIDAAQRLQELTRLEDFRSSRPGGSLTPEEIKEMSELQAQVSSLLDKFLRFPEEHNGDD